DLMVDEPPRERDAPGPFIPGIVELEAGGETLESRERAGLGRRDRRMDISASKDVNRTRTERRLEVPLRVELACDRVDERGRRQRGELFLDLSPVEKSGQASSFGVVADGRSLGEERADFRGKRSIDLRLRIVRDGEAELPDQMLAAVELRELDREDDRACAALSHDGRREAKEGGVRASFARVDSPRGRLVAI